MKNYFFVETEEGQEIFYTDPHENIWNIPLDPANSDYAEYLRYTEWVEAGNDPNEFWEQEEI